MSLRPDSWIRRRAREGMIEPFEERQVREGMISYGLSSYGYDIRVADEYKIFTNVNNSLVDPKNFDPASFVDFHGPVCIVPPNSFALGRSIEYFRIPRSVMTITVGKSTYARCFRGDTRVALVDGTTPTMEETALRCEAGEMVWGYSLGEFGRVMVTLLEAARCVGRDALLEIVLESSQSIHCTPDHDFILRDGRRLQAHELRPGSSLMPLYLEVMRGYESVYQPIDGHFCPTHRLADEWNVRHGIYTDTPRTHRHHRDHDRRNNNPWNIGRMRAREHIRLHNAQSYGDAFDPEKHAQAISAALARRSQDAAWREHYSRVQSERASRFWSEEAYADARQRLIELRSEITEESVRSALKSAGSIKGAARLLGCDRSVFRRFATAIPEFRGRTRSNHKVARVRELPGEHDVFCLTVPEAGNFALAAGVFVRNCGIITNVTPLEPEWEGHVTLEISNTTPLPAKIYSNEGIAQVIFFESDESCEVSYADRGGKYQAQRGVTLPRL